MIGSQQSLLDQLPSLKAATLSAVAWIYISVITTIIMFCRLIFSYNFPKIDSSYSSLSSNVIVFDGGFIFSVLLFFLIANLLPSIICSSIIIKYKINKLYYALITFIFIFNIQFYLFNFPDRMRNEKIKISLLGELQSFVHMTASTLPYALIVGPIVWCMTSKLRARYLADPTSTSLSP